MDAHNPLVLREVITTTTVGVRVDAVKSLESVSDVVVAALLQSRPWLMTFVNPATAVIARRSAELRNALRNFDLVAPDGIGMVIAMRLLHRQNPTRISFDGTSLAPIIFRLAVERGLRLVVCGGEPGVAEEARRKIIGSFPGIQIVGAFDGYVDMTVIIPQVKSLAPDIVIAGMGAVVQERFLLTLVQSGWCGVGFTCGGYLDQIAQKGTSYYPAWVDRYDLRWAYRLVMEPRRLWWRYLVEYPQFGIGVCAALFREREDKLHG